MLKRQFRIRTGRQYNNIYKYGNKIGGRYLLVYIMKKETGGNRFGVVTSKKVGKAVKRNRVKRQIRAIINQRKNEVPGNNDFIVIARHHIFGVNSQELEKDFLKIIKKAKL
ncbi:MAG: ribonuclease P protein component [Syntrophomonas sp.]